MNWETFTHSLWEGIIWLGVIGAACVLMWVASENDHRID